MKKITGHAPLLSNMRCTYSFIHFFFVLFQKIKRSVNKNALPIKFYIGSINNNTTCCLLQAPTHKYMHRDLVSYIHCHHLMHFTCTIALIQLNSFLHSCINILKKKKNCAYHHPEPRLFNVFVFADENNNKSTISHIWLPIFGAYDRHKYSYYVNLKYKYILLGSMLYNVWKDTKKMRTRDSQMHKLVFMRFFFVSHTHTKKGVNENCMDATCCSTNLVFFSSDFMCKCTKKCVIEHVMSCITSPNTFTYKFPSQKLNILRYLTIC